MTVILRDEHFLERADRERELRRHKSLAKTVQQLVEERLAEIAMGKFLPPATTAEMQQQRPQEQ